MTDTDLRPDATTELREALTERVLIMDGAMGTMIQQQGLSEADFRGERFADWGSDLQGNNDLLVLTQPELIVDLHHQYLAAGADLVETNTFNAQRISLADYGMADLAHEINLEAARLARRAADEAMAADPTRPRWVMGALGPTNRTASISPDVNDPGLRNITFDELVEAYLEQASGLVEGGVDLLIVETIFDTLNAKAAIFALETLFEQHGRRWPVIISGTITDASGRTLTGQTTEAFWNSVRHAQPLAIGLNCALGAEELRQYVVELGRVADTFVSAYPNAGLPNAFGEYDQSPEYMAELVAEFATSGLVNLLGGCCGSSPSTSRPSPAGPPAPRRTSLPTSSRRCACPVSSPSTSPPTRSSSTSASGPMSRARRSSASSSRRPTTPRRSPSPSSRSRAAPRSSTSTWTRACSTASPRWAPSSTSSAPSPTSRACP